MIAYTHLSMIAFVILGLSMVRLMIAFSSLMSKNHNDDPDDDEDPVEVVTSNLPAPGIIVILCSLIGALFVNARRRQ